MAPTRRLLTLALLALNYTLSLAQQTTNPGTCDVDDGKYHKDAKGQTYKIVCNNKIGVGELSRTMRPNFASCMDRCSLTDGCKAVDFTVSSGICIFYNKAIKGTTAERGTHTAYLEDDPSTKPKDDQNIQVPIVPVTPVVKPVTPSLVTVTNPACPGDDGKAFVADDGTYYKIQCGYHAVGKELAKYSDVPSFSDCIKKCSEMNGCISVQYIGPPGASGYTLNECILSDGEGPGTTTCAHWFAYTIDPPATAEDKPFPYTLCETVCPFSDGMIYESDSGENFKMSCSKRHGTTILWTQPAATFDECMDICGKVLPCHSVDYHARTGKCYLGNHHGAPAISAPGFASATTMGCAGACKKSCICPAGAT